MASVSVEFSAFSDPRFKVLGRLTNIDHFSARGRCEAIWMYCIERCQEFLEPITIDVLAELDGFSDAMIKSKLADTPDENGLIRIRGTSGRIEYLENARKRQKKATDAAKAAKEAKRAASDSQFPTSEPKLDPKLVLTLDPKLDPPLDSSSTSASASASASNKNKYPPPPTILTKKEGVGDGGRGRVNQISSPEWEQVKAEILTIYPKDGPRLEGALKQIAREGRPHREGEIRFPINFIRKTWSIIRKDYEHHDPKPPPKTPEPPEPEQTLEEKNKVLQLKQLSFGQPMPKFEMTDQDRQSEIRRQLQALATHEAERTYSAFI